MRTQIIIFLALIIFTSCKRKNQVQTKNVNTVFIDTIKKKGTNISEIYIGKKFYEGDELVNYTYSEGGYLSKDSILTFSVYENKNEYIYSLENQVSNEDVKEYIILDTLIFKKLNIKKLKYFSYPLNNNRIISFFADEHGEKITIDMKSKKIKR